jgi:tripartite-type tricarboxylate transporter receptor subunit TctC
MGFHHQGGLRMFKVRFFQIVAVSVSCLAAPIASSQDAYPDRPVKIVVPYPPGGATDSATRVFAQGLGELLGQQFIVENRAGGGTNIGASYVAHSEPDGYTLYVANFASNGVNKWLYKKLSYDPDKDFAPVALMTLSPMFLVVHPSVPANSVKELVRLAKTSPGKLTYGSTGIGSPNHIVGELFRMQTDIKVVHVPYKGSALSSLGLLGGETDYIFDATAMTYVHAGKLKVLAVAYTKRWPTEPDVPSMAELGYPGVSVEPFFALVAPANTPVSIRQKLNDAARTIGKRPDTASKLAPIGVIPTSLTLQETADFLREQSTKWAPVVKASGAQAD